MNSLSCNTTTGSFQVLEVDIGPTGELRRLHVMFEQHCEGAAPALTGEFWIVANPWR